MRQVEKAGEVEEWRYGHVLYFLFQLTLVFLGAISVGHSQGAKGGIIGSLLDTTLKLGSSNVEISVYDAPDQLVRTKVFSPKSLQLYQSPSVRQEAS